MNPSTPNPTPDFTKNIASWHEHIRILSEEIGPRGPTTEDERRAAQYGYQVFEKSGLAPQIETFDGARSIFQPHLLASIAMLTAFVIYPLAGRVSAAIAAILALIALASDLYELSLRDNLIRRLVPKSTSQNVVAKMQPAAEIRQDLVLIGHLDSQRTPLIFSTSRWLSAYQRFTTIAFVCFLAEAVLYILGIFTQWAWIWPVTGISALCAILLAAMCLEADNTPFTHGANDNATGAALVMTLAESIKTQPLQHTRIWLVCSGCEETQHYGAIDFFQRHRAELHNPKVLVFEMLGCAGPAWLKKEGIIIPFNASPQLIALAEDVSRQYPELCAYPTFIVGGNTEMADALRIGIPAITLTGLGVKGESPYWHQVSDTFDKIDPLFLARNFTFTWHFIHSLDDSA
jgi:hypothetical protein